jgi:hypothetical protein
VKFFFPDSQDQIDPGFDFTTEEYGSSRVRQRGDHYAHEALSRPPYDGTLVSKTVVDGMATSAGRYSLPQRHRLFRVGVRRFFRLDQPDRASLEAMGDCGAFSYINEDTPPYSVDEIIDFYDGCDFDYGMSLDHVILGYIDNAREVPEEWRRRRDLTLALADVFLTRHKSRGCRFLPIGVAQGWSPATVAGSVSELQAMGYRRIALGGMAALKTTEILACLRACDDVRRSDTQLHLLGVTRCDHILSFEAFGVTSFDSTSPFRQAFKDERDNYYTVDRTYTALRVPQVDGNPKLKRRISAGQLDQARALAAERRCLRTLEAYDTDTATLEVTLAALLDYSDLCGETADRRPAYVETLRGRPWKACLCGLCARLGIHIVLFRGSERNKARGFHNLHVFRERLNLRHPGMALRSA